MNFMDESVKKELSEIAAKYTTNKKSSLKEILTYTALGVALTLQALSLNADDVFKKNSIIDTAQSKKIETNISSVTYSSGAFSNYQEIKNDCGKVDLYEPTPALESWEPCIMNDEQIETIINLNIKDALANLPISL